MFRTATDQLNFTSRTRSLVEYRYPDEVVLFSSAATILETAHETPTGWSLRRFLQRRGNVVITDARVFVQSSFLSLFTGLWLAVVVYGVHQYVQRGDSFNIVLAAGAAVLIVQRRPYSCDVPFNSVDRTYFGSVRGLTGRCDIVSLVVHGRAVQLVTGQFIPDGVRERLTVPRDTPGESVDATGGGAVK